MTDEPQAMTDLERLATSYIPMVEAEMRQVLVRPVPGLDAHYGMLQYHMGWVDDGFRPTEVEGGKRVRPLLCLLACRAVGGSVDVALPAAAALELLHNFSLIHDDIEDDSPTRRHRPTVWSVWGRPQAINVGDTMFTLARMALHRLPSQGLPATSTLRVFEVFDDTCLRLTEGQFLDMSFESRLDVTVAEYVSMIAGKTAALLGASMRIGGLIGGADDEVCDHLDEYGRSLGMAFQIRDDWLGIWGDESLIGKSAQSDILNRKKSLPVVFALTDPEVGPELRRLYARPLTPSDVPTVLALLDRAGARSVTEDMAEEAHSQALLALAASNVDREEDVPGRALRQVAETLRNRNR